MHGIERHKGAAEYADTLGLNVDAGLIEEAEYLQNHFDLVTFIDTFYYVEDPVLPLEKAHHFLKPGGLPYMRLMNSNLFLNMHYWLSMLGFLRSDEIPNRLGGDIVWSFSPRSLMLLLRKTAFANVKLPSDTHKCKRRGLLVKTLYFLPLPVLRPFLI